MNNLVRVSLSSILLFTFNSHIPSNAENINIQEINSKLESSLNNRDTRSLFKLFENEKFSLLKKEYEDFILRFPDAKWTIKDTKIKGSKKDFIEIKINGTRALDNQIYLLHAKQLISLDIKNNHIENYNVIQSSSVLKTTKSKLNISISSPDKVLTGSRYDVDIILEKPLGDNFLSGGLMILNKEKVNQTPSEYIDIYPLGSGGLFKSIQAPFKPGNQTFAALLLHPEGIISITKTIQIVSSASKDSL